MGNIIYQVGSFAPSMLLPRVSVGLKAHLSTLYIYKIFNQNWTLLWFIFTQICCSINVQQKHISFFSAVIQYGSSEKHFFFKTCI